MIPILLKDFDMICYDHMVEKCTCGGVDCVDQVKTVVYQVKRGHKGLGDRMIEDGW